MAKIVEPQSLGNSFVLPVVLDRLRLRRALRATVGVPQDEQRPSADHLSRASCSTAALDRTFCWAEVIASAVTGVLVDELLLAGTLVLRPTTSAMLPRCQ